ncbi:MAG: hypothetical protein ACREPD_05945 [Stenotrophomonas sp.]|uniref:hypothetical protein n=1 Tax=Stenotrophomonas sp. TaxID=69392 RepID=UPI003D6D18F2
MREMHCTYTLPIHIPVSLVAISIVMVVAGIMNKRRDQRLNRFNIIHLGFWLAAGFGLLCAVATGSDRIVFDEQKLEEDGWIQARKGFPLKNLVQVTITNENRLGGKLRTDSIEVWTATYRDDSSIRVQAGDLWKTNRPAIVEKLLALGVTVTER